MSGKKGRSGRLPLLKEAKIEEILDIASDILIKWLRNTKVDFKKKIQVVAQLITKRVPSKLEHSGNIGKIADIYIIRDNQKEKISGSNGEGKDRIQANQEARPSI